MSKPQRGVAATRRPAFRGRIACDTTLPAIEIAAARWGCTRIGRSARTGHPPLPWIWRIPRVSPPALSHYCCALRNDTRARLLLARKFAYIYNVHAHVSVLRKDLRSVVQKLRTCYPDETSLRHRSPESFDKRRVKNFLLNRFENERRGQWNRLYRDSSRRNALEVNAPKFVRVNGSRFSNRPCMRVLSSERNRRDVTILFSDIRLYWWLITIRAPTLLGPARKLSRRLSRPILARVYLQVVQTRRSVKRVVHESNVRSTAKIDSKLHAWCYESPLSMRPLAFSALIDSCWVARRQLHKCCTRQELYFPASLYLSHDCQDFRVQTIFFRWIVTDVSHRPGHINPVV